MNEINQLKNKDFRKKEQIIKMKQKSVKLTPLIKQTNNNKFSIIELPLIDSLWYQLNLIT